MKRFLAAAVALLAVGSVAKPAQALKSITLIADRDTSIQDGSGISPAGAVNGNGTRLYVGGINGGGNGVDRALIHFNLGSIATGSVATAATFTIRAVGRSYVTPPPGSLVVNVHRITASWGEGASVGTHGPCGGASQPACGGGGGLETLFASPQTSDATWTVRFTPSPGCSPFCFLSLWGSAGGDFAASSGTITLPALAPPNVVNAVPIGGGILSDVNSWLTTPANNNGWLLEADGGLGANLLSKNNGSVNFSPTLVISYRLPNGATGCSTGDDCTGGNCLSGGICCNSACNTPTAPCQSLPATGCASGVCQYTNTVSACDDGVFCNGSDTCSGGTCSVHPGNPCSGQNVGPNCNDSCNEAADNCTAPDTAGTSCNDNNICTTGETCNGSGTCNGGANNALSCDDGLFCNGTDTCGSGTCNHSGNPCPVNTSDSNCATSCNEASDNCTAPDPNGTGCNDGNVCTSSDQCTGGVCSGTNNAAACNDGIFCNGNDTCSGGSCAVHAGDPCLPLNTTDGNCSGSCNEGAKACTAPDPNGTACNDGTFCNGTDTCNAGACSTHSGDPCLPLTTTDGNCAASCNEASDNCTAPDPNGTGCNDGNVCTSSDQCSAGTCTGTNNTVACNDGLFCNGTDTCGGGSCSSHSGNPCPGHNVGPNCNDSCNEASDNCTASDTNGTGCDDGNVCTSTDVCTGGACGGTNNTAACNDGLFCNGADTCAGGACTTHAGNPCPGHNVGPNCNDSCNEASDNCTANDANGTGCSDGLFCNGNDTCSSGACSTHAGDPCLPLNTTDGNCSTSCNEAQDACNAADPNGTSCSDGLFCNGTDSCTSGACSTHAGDPCLPLNTADSDCSGSCNEANDNCTANDPNTTPCSDGLFCNGTDSCTSGACSTHAGDPCLPLNTADSNCAGSCNETSDSCTANDPNTTPCSDGLFCNGTDSCTSGACTTHAGDPCLPLNTADSNCAGSCNETNDNCTANDPNTTACNDGLFCNGADSCTSGACTTHAGDPCLPLNTTDSNCAGSCNETSDNCTANDPNTTACSDGLFCNGVDSCTSGACSTHAGNPCPGHNTGPNCNDSCNEASDNCTANDASLTPCNDSLFCNGTDTCNGSGACSNHAGDPCLPLNTTDGNCKGSCNETSDNCTANDPNGTSCSDGLTCNAGESCQSGSCAGGSSLDCSAQADQCHTGVCNEPGGCAAQNVANGTGCSDGNACTTGDTCQAGTCTGGVAPNCNDNNPCTTDGCNPATGCTHSNVANGTACTNDGNPCTVDTCQGGVCNTPVPNGTSCGAAPSCSGSIPNAQAIPAVTCNAGVCPSQSPVACGATTPCNASNTACQGTCAIDTDCPSGFFCNTGTDLCEAVHGIGGACSRTAMCSQSSQALTCVDSVCCTSACGGGVTTDCQTCNGTSPGTCTSQNATPCNDGLFCNGPDTCVTGACTQHAGNPCPGADGDGNCAESCNEAADNCTLPDPNGSICNDGLFCNVGETCTAGICGGGASRDCSAFTDQCNTGVCNETSDQCQAQPVSATSCTDNNACTTNDQCNGGVCQGGAAPNCNDNNACTNDSCVPASGCTHSNVADGTGCGSDSNPCTLDTCLAGACHAPVSNSTPCGAPASCSGTIPNAQAVPAVTCNNGTCPAQNPVACGATTPCNPANTACQGACSTDADCPSTFFCNLGTNLCEADHGIGGACSRTAMCSQATQALTCVDSVCCTSACGGGVTTDCQTCNGSSPGTCTNLNGTPCNDGLFCNGVDICITGACATHSGNPCPGQDTGPNCNDSCNEAADNCTANDANTTPCSDGLFCTVGEACQSGSCTGGTPRDCSSVGNQCNTGSCNETTDQCVAQPLSGISCNDNNACTTSDTCNNGSCTGATANCDDNNVCTTDSCNSSGGCIHTPNTVACNDNDACTINDKCNGAGACVGGAAPNCNDNNACTDDTCVPATGCTHTNNNANACTDGNACTSGDHCQAGACVSTGTVNCDDSNVCTDDSCAPATGCAHAANTVACDDNDKCTSNDECSNSVCVGGPAVTCNDNKPCTDDACSPLVGCTFTNDDTNSCSDGNACTSGDHCQAGSCSGTTVTCDDANPCTDDSCAPASGCVFAANTRACDDGNKCTTNDICANKQCVGGPAPVCNDNNPCTVDSCDKVIGCIAPPGNAGSQCRVANGACDVAEVCDGLNATCPADGFDIGKQCSASSCANGKQTLAAMCNGQSSACPAALVQDCAPFICGATACLSKCTTENDCTIGYYCAPGGQCTPKSNPGDPCTDAVQCLSNFCADGLCCNSDCSGKCEACNLPASKGTCTPVTGAPVGAQRGTCPGDGTGCDGACDGINTQSCTMPGTSQQCRAPSCVNNTATLAEFCDGSGSCPPVRTQPCGSGICGATACEGCPTDADCPSGQFCRAGVCSPQGGNGTTCSRSGECASGHCVDGFCCSSDCTGQCEACNIATKEGTCTPVAAGGKPVGSRTACNGGDPTRNICAGSCDGTNTRSCAYLGFGTMCRAADCQSDRATLVAFCDGHGSCPPLEQENCSNGCDGTMCAGGVCVKDTDCNGGNGQYCAAGQCEPTKPSGAACNTSVECSSTLCVDGFCCNQSCNHQCEACDVPGSEGTCTAVTGAPHGSRQACAGDTPVCAGQCNGTIADRCAYPGASTACGAPAKCVDAVATLAGACQGDGSCSPVMLQDCGVAGCDGSGVACEANCKTDADCVIAPADGGAGFQGYCSAGVCTTRLPNGAPCGIATQCSSGHCVDEVCCESDCAGQCQSCNQANKAGQCVTVIGLPRGGRAACIGSGACAGFCDGTKPNACTLPGTSVKCGAPFCASGFATPAPTCRGNGECVVSSTPADCYPFACESNGQDCVTTCALDTDCAPGNICNSGGCEPPVPPTPDGGGVDASAGGAPDASVGTGGAVNTGGTTGTGGSAGSAGATNGGTSGGGTAGSAGTGNTAGSVGTASGGSAPVDGGVAGTDAGKDGGPKGGAESKDEGSCGCRVVGRETGSGTELLGALAGLALMAARRRRRIGPS